MNPFRSNRHHAVAATVLISPVAPVALCALSGCNGDTST